MSLHLFAIKNKRLRPKEIDGYFSEYLNQSNLTIQQLKRPKFKKFIFN